jgi:flagellar hook-associated protein 1 FlgK
MSLYLALNNALAGLNVNQRQLSVLSQNITNANTPGYSRQTPQQSARYIEGVGAGVRIDDVTRKIDFFLQRSVRTKTSDVGSSAAINDYLERAQILLGQPGDESSVDAKVETYFNSLQRLAESPEIPSRRTDVVGAATQLTQQISGLSYNVNELRYQADRDINEGVKFINDQLKRLLALNTAVNRANALGNSTAGLEDQQDQTLKSISEYMDIQVIKKNTGEAFVYAPNGIPLIDENLYQLQYSPAGSLDTFTKDGTLNALNVFRADDNGNFLSESPYVLATAGTSSSVTTVLGSGKIKGLLDIRDKILPDSLSQFDSLAAVLRDQVNKVHNSGSGFPGATSFTGTRSISATEQYEWSGKFRVALLDQSGNPIPSAYSDETTTGGIRPLTIDLSKLNSGQGAGKPTVQSIIDEINFHFGSPQPRAKLGPLNTINLVTNSSSIPGTTNSFNFDFELENLGRNDADFFITGLTVLDSVGTNMGAPTTTIPQVALNPLNTYTTIGVGSGNVTVSTLTNHGYQPGQTIFLSTPPGGPFNGITGPQLGGFFTIQSVTANTFTITTAGSATAVGSSSVAGQTSNPKYDTATAGLKERTGDAGTITANVAINPFSPFYDVTANVATKDDSGNIITSTITYRITNNQVNTTNDRYYATNVTGAGSRETSSTNQTYVRAIMVDANGNEISKSNGNYIDQKGFLKLVSGSSSFFISMDELDSKQLGLPSDVPPVAGTNRGLSHFFELNNFFKSNISTSTGDTVKGSALALAVEDRIVKDNNLVSTGTLSRSKQPSDTTKPPIWTYSRYSGDNDLAQKLAKLGLDPQTFSAAGNLPAASTSFNGYAGQVLGFTASTAATAQSTLDDDNILLEGFSSRSDAISGVNLDEELANTVIYQNAYAASARIITVVNQMFDDLIGAIQ